MANTILEDLYRHNRWANAHIVRLCDGLTDDQLDQPRELGFGTLRNTVFHILAAEDVWLDRWTGVAPKPFPVDAQGLSVGEIGERLEQITLRRNAWLAEIGSEGLAMAKSCTYANLKGNRFTESLPDLMLHVANHGIHHRAQALSFLKTFGRTIRGGLDYLFFRFAYPQIKQEPEAAEAMKQFGLELETGSSPVVAWDADLVQKYFRYGDWCNQQVFELAGSLVINTTNESVLDRDFSMGMGTLRKTMLHLFDPEQFWLRNWTTEELQFRNSPTTMTLTELQDRWLQVIEARDHFIASQDQESVSRVLRVSFGGPPFKVSMIESMIQLCGHGTHHRAQLVNMLRHSGAKAPAMDYVVWARQQSL